MKPRIVVRSAGRGSPIDQVPIAKVLDSLSKDGCRRRPFYSGCWASMDRPPGTEVVERYRVKGAEVQVLSSPRGTGFVYHLRPWEYQIPDDWMKLIRLAQEELLSDPPGDLDIPLERLRASIETRARAVMAKAISQMDPGFSTGPLERARLITALSEIVGRYTVGLGVFEILLDDEHVQDIFVDAPAAENPVHVMWGGDGSINQVIGCPTNLVVSEVELAGLASRLRHISGRSFSHAFPILEADVPEFETRATLVGPPLSPSGVSIALRRRSRIPWTLTRMIFNGTLEPLTAGLLSFIAEGSSTLLIGGARGSGKSSLLSALLFELPLSQRVLTIEDTAELPVEQMQEVGFNVQSLVVEQKLGERIDMKVEEALRVSLRLGESAIVLGEVRGKEAQTLYEGMRTGRAGSSVMCTIHGDSARSIYERVVHDMHIPPEAFGATDIVVTMGMVRSLGGYHRSRRVVEITELAKERGYGEFNPLGTIDGTSGSLKLDIEGSETVERIARLWGIRPDVASENIVARARVKEILSKAALNGRLDFLSPHWTIECNEFLWHSLRPDDSCLDNLTEEFKTWLKGKGVNEDLG